MNKEYTYYISTYSVPDPTTGKTTQKSVTGKTRKQVKEKLDALRKKMMDSSPSLPSEITVKNFLSAWVKNYTVNIKSGTKASYVAAINKHINPALGRYVY